MDLGNYLFIDGNYLRRAYEDTMRMFFQNVSADNVDLESIKNSLGASKAFFYDSVDIDAPDADRRREYLEHIRSLDGFHVREGTISRAKRKQQKQVDVRVAVECLTHAFRKNVWHVSLLVGDLDFKPLVDALIDLGIHVHVVYEPKSGARPLYRAADVARPITLDQFWQWSSHQYRVDHPAPVDTTIITTDHPPGTVTLDYQGEWRGRQIRLYGTANHDLWVLWLMPHGDKRPLILRYPDKDRLLKYFILNFGGEVTWTKSF